MKNTISMYKRLGAMALCLVLLCGVIMSTMVFPAAAAPSSVKTFAADFGDLAKLVDSASYQNGAYTSKETDTTINEWVNKRFGIYSSREGSGYWTLAYLGQESNAYNPGDAWSGSCSWEILQSGYLQHTTNYAKGGGQMLRKSQTLTVKTESGSLALLKNFEASMVFNKSGNNKLASVFISFRESDPGRVNTVEGKQVTSGNEMVIVGNAAGGYQKSGKDGIILGHVGDSATTTNEIKVEDQFSNALDNNTDYRLTVKVVGTQLTATVAKADDDTVVYTGTTTINAGEGYLSFGASNFKRRLKSVSVTELDESGNPVAFGTNTPLPYSTFDFDPADMTKLYKYSGHYWTFTDNISDNATLYRNAVSEKFNTYYNNESKYVQTKGIGYKAVYDGQTDNFANFNTHLYSSYLQRNTANITGNEAMRLISSLVPKNGDGVNYCYKNFETDFTFFFENTDTNVTGGGAVIGFRQQTPGRFATGYFGLGQDMGFLFVSRTGMTLAAGKDIVAGSKNANDMYNRNATLTFDTALPSKTPLNISLRVVNAEATVKITNKQSGATLYESATPFAINYDTAGAIAYGVTSIGHDIGAISLTHLDDAGNPIDIDKQTKEEKSAKAEKFRLSLSDITPYVNDKYVVEGENYPYNYISLSKLPAVENLLKSRLAFYFNHEGSFYGEVEPSGNAGGAAGSGNWILFFNKWLQRSGAQGWGERVRQINSFIPKDKNGSMAQLKNFTASFDYRFESYDKGDGAMLIGFRQKTPGKFVNGYNAMNTEQALIAITPNSIGVAGGTDITKEKFYTYNQLEDTFDEKLPQEVHVEITAIGKKVTVEISSMGGNSLYKKEYTVNYTEKGYLAFGVGATSGNYGELIVTRLDDAGMPTDFTEAAWQDEAFADGKLRFSADFKNLAGRVDSFTNGSYRPSSTDDAINRYIRTKFDLRFEREGGMSERNYLGQSSAEIEPKEADIYAGVSYWTIGEAGYLTRSNDGSIGGEMLRKAEILVPKTITGSVATVLNFEAEVVIHDQRHQKGAVAFSFRNDSLAQISQGWKNVYAGQQLVAVGVDHNGDAGIVNGGGSEIGGSRNDGPYMYVTDKVAALKTVTDYKLIVRALGEDITVKVTSLDGATEYYSASKKAVINRKGYIYLGVTNAERSIAKITITELDANGNVINFGANTVETTDSGDFSFTTRDIIPYENSKYVTGGNPWYDFVGKYGDKAEADASTLINYIDNKFSIYYNSEGAYYPMEAGVKTAFIDQKSNFGYFSGVYGNRWLQRPTKAVGGRQIFRLVTSLVPRNSVTGEELTFKNFETSYKVRFEGTSDEKSSSIFGFRQQIPGKFNDSYWKITKEQAFVSITREGVTVAAGDSIYAKKKVENGAHRPDTGDMYNDHQTAKFETQLPQNIKVNVRVVGSDVTVKITNEGGSTTYYEGTTQIDYDKTGYLAYGIGSAAGNLADINITRLDDEGNRIDINGSEGPVGCPWDTTPTRYSQLANSSTNPVADTFKDVYYHAMQDGKPVRTTETLDKHWELNSETGVLMRKNDLSDNATANVSMIAMSHEGSKMKLENFDAIFKLRFDETKTGTFWVTARQTDEANCGKVVTTPGDTDYLSGQVAVGLSVGGKVTIATGDGTAVELAGPTAGTPSGDYTLRVKLSGNRVTVYLNGTARGSRTVTAKNAGYLCFGYSGAELGLSSVRITKLNEYGATVDLTTNYTGTETLPAITVPVNADVASLNLRTQVEAMSNNGNAKSDVFWDMSTVDLTTEGDYNLIGYLKNTNGVRAVQKVYVGAYDRDNTVKYGFDSAGELDDFDTYFLPEAQTFNNPAIYVKGTENDTFEVSNGKLKYRNTTLRRDDKQLEAGFELGGSQWKDTTTWSGYSSNFGIALLKTRTYKNFILDMDFTSSGRWTQVGFGAQGGADGTYGTQVKGGYTFHVEYNGGSGTANISQYQESTGKHGNSPREVAFPVFKSGSHHYRIIVSDGIAYFYCDDNADPWVVELGDKYTGGYIYLGLNDASHTIDNLKIVDLDAKEIDLVGIKTQVDDVTIDRSKGESMPTLPKSVIAVDSKNNEYPLMATWNNSEYRSYKDGRFDFAASFKGFHNMNLSSSLAASLTVNNSINGDFDPTTTMKYYFDHDNDLLDFTAYYSQQQEKAGYWKNAPDSTDYWTAYDGDLVKADAPTDKWKIVNGKLMTSYGYNPGGYGGASYGKGVSTLILNDLNLINFEIQVDFKQGTNIWYNAVAVGVNDPTKYVATCKQGINAKPDGSDTAVHYNRDNGAGAYIHLEQEGFVNFRGGVDTSEGILRITEDMTSNDFIATYDKSVEHHMTIRVIDGTVMFKIDNSDTFVAELSGATVGGYVGLSAYGNQGTFANFQITALGNDNEPTPLDTAERGFAPEAKPDDYIGWQPSSSGWVFKWGPEYEE